MSMSQSSTVCCPGAEARPGSGEDCRRVDLGSAALGTKARAGAASRERISAPFMVDWSVRGVGVEGRTGSVVGVDRTSIDCVESIDKGLAGCFNE